MPWVMLARGAACGWLPRVVLGAICCGLWFALLTAWSCDLINNVWPRLQRRIDVYVDPMVFGSSVRSIDIPPSTEWDQLSGTAMTSFGLAAWQTHFWRTLPDNRVSIVASESRPDSLTANLTALNAAMGYARDELARASQAHAYAAAS